MTSYTIVQAAVMETAKERNTMNRAKMIATTLCVLALSACSTWGGASGGVNAGINRSKGVGPQSQSAQTEAQQQPAQRQAVGGSDSGHTTCLLLEHMTPAERCSVYNQLNRFEQEQLKSGLTTDQALRLLGSCQPTDQ